MPLEIKRSRERIYSFLGYKGSVIGLREIIQGQYEFVATKPSHHVARTHAPLQPRPRS